MSIAYWKMVAESVAQGLGPKTISRLGAGGRILGRTGAIAGAGFMAYELFKSYKDNIENEQAYQEMVILQGELEKWGSAISCLGREPFENEEFGSFAEGGAVNALSPKQLLDNQGIKPPDPEAAIELITRATDYIIDTENILEDEKFGQKKDELVSQLKQLIPKIKATSDYRAIQKEITNIVSGIKPIESGYTARIYQCSREIQKSLGSNAAWAAISMVTLGFVKKPKKE